MDPKPDFSDSDVEEEFAVIRKAALYQHPTSDVETMLTEIERGYELDLEFPDQRYTSVASYL